MSQSEQLSSEQLTPSINPAPTIINANTTIQSNGQFDAPVTSGASSEPKQEEALKKPDEPVKIKRPMNPFMIFGCEKRRKLAQVHPRMHNSEISKILGSEWKRMSEYEKAPYVQEAKRLKEQHSIEYPNYKFKANRRKPRQSVKKERPTFPYAEPNAIPAMKFPYTASPFFQDPAMYSLYAMPGGSHPAFPMYANEYSSQIIRQGMTAGATRAVQPPTTTAASGDYYSLNKGSVPPVNDYYPASNKSSEYYATMHPAAVPGGRSERNTAAGEVVNLSDRYNSGDNRQFDRSYPSTFNGSQGSSVVTYTTMQNISHLSNESPTAYSYTSLYEPRH